MASKDDEESDVLKEMFGEIMKMIHDKQIKIEAIIQIMTEHDKISQDTFNRIYRVLSEYGERKKWL